MGLKSLAKLFNFVVCNLSQSSPSLTILFSVWFIIISFNWCFSIFVKYYFPVSFNLKVIFSMVKMSQNTVTEVKCVKSSRTGNKICGKHLLFSSKFSSVTYLDFLHVRTIHDDTLNIKVSGKII